MACPPESAGLRQETSAFIQAAMSRGSVSNQLQLDSIHAPLGLWRHLPMWGKGYNKTGGLLESKNPRPTYAIKQELISKLSS